MPIKSYLFLFNIAKESNFGFLVRTANAFGAEPIVIGRKKYNSSGAVGGTSNTPTHHFYTLPDATKWAREERGCRVLGLEIKEDAKPVNDSPFAGSTAFLIGNEGTGLEDWQMELCDDFVYIPQFGTAVSLNINAATAVCLHRFSDWAKREDPTNWRETPRSGDQYIAQETVIDWHQRFRAENK